MNPIKLFLKGERAKAKRLAKRYEPFQLSIMAKDYGFEGVSRFALAGYLLGIIKWETLLHNLSWHPVKDEKKKFLETLE